MSDDLELILKAKANNADCIEAIVIRYKSLVCRIARSYYLVSGGDTDDLIQEGTIGLLKAIRNYDPKRNKNFAAFAAFCIKNNIKDALRRATSDKNKVLNEAAELEDLSSYLTIQIPDPMSEYIDKEQSDRLFSKLSGLINEQQLDVLKLYLDGYSYQEMAKMLNKSPKFIDNTLNSVKNKLKKQYSNLQINKEEE